MKLIKEGLGILGRAYWGMSDDRSFSELDFDRSRLYLKWGEQSGQIDDFMQALSGLKNLSPKDLTLEENLERHGRMLKCLIECLRMKLKNISEVFDFLCDHRGKIELRSLNFKKQLHECIEDFMQEEEGFLKDGEDFKKSLLDLPLGEGLKERRKTMLEVYDARAEEVSEGLEAFYQRVKAYVQEG